MDVIVWSFRFADVIVYCLTNQTGNHVYYQFTIIIKIVDAVVL